MPGKKTILLAGLAEREAAAVQMIIAQAWPAWHSLVLPRRADFQIPVQDPQAQACSDLIVNLLGIGLLRHSPDAQSKLEQFLAGRSAVLLLHSGDQSWLGAAWNLAPGQKVHCLQPPCSSLALRQAIQACGMDAASPASQLERQTALQASPNHTEQKTAQRAKADGHQARPNLASHGAKTYNHIGNGALAELERAIPALQQSPWLQLVKQILQTGRQSHFEIGPTHFVLDMQAGWLASALPSSALQKMLHTPQLLSQMQMQMQRLAAENTLALAEQSFGQRLAKAQKALDMVSWEVGSESLKNLPLALEHDLSLRLRRYPNFPLLTHAGPLDMQLASLCAQTPRSVAELLRCFAHEQQAVLRFAALSVISGLALVAPVHAAMPQAQLSQTAKPKTDSSAEKAKQGFFKALLNKLF